MAAAKTRIRKAVFPVAGLGTRFLPATKAVPKEMLTVVDRPVIQHVVDEARAAGSVGTLLGRRRFLPDLNSANRAARRPRNSAPALLQTPAPWQEEFWGINARAEPRRGKRAQPGTER